MKRNYSNSNSYSYSYRFRYKKLLLLLAVTGVCFWGFWTWFFGFGGYAKTIDWTKAHPRFNRVKLLLDYPLYETFFKTMKVYDPLFPKFWTRKITLPIYRLEIQPEDLVFLNHNLPQPYSARGLDEKYQVSVGAKLITDGTELDVKVRYRGDLPIHWSEKKKSWRLEKSDGEVTNLIVPEARGFFAESMANYRARKLGLMAQNDDFIWLVINGKDIGVYYRTGHWDEFWLKSQDKPISELLGEYDYETGRPDFTNVWNGITNWKYYTWRPDKTFPNSLYLQRFIDIVNRSSDDDFVNQLAEVVDLDSLVRWSALSTLMHNSHTDDRHNWRLWLDPVTKKFHFIPTDSAIEEANQLLWDEGQIVDLKRENNRLLIRTDQSPELRLMRDRVLWDYVLSKDQLDDDLRFWDQLNSRVLPMLYRDRSKRRGNIALSSISKCRQIIINRYRDLYDYLSYQDLKLRLGPEGRKLFISSTQPTSVEINRVTINGLELEKNGLRLHYQQVIELPIDCPQNCLVTVEAINLVTNSPQEVSS